MASIYKNIVELSDTTTIDSTGVLHHYLCKERAASADYTVTLPISGVETGDILTFEGSENLTKVVTLTAGTGHFIGDEQSVALKSRYTYLLKWNGSNWVICAKGGIPEGSALPADTTVDFNSSMTVAEIQALIDAQPKDLGGHTLTFQFADGTYTFGLNELITFSGFVSGKLVIQGNPAEDKMTKHTNQSVIIRGQMDHDSGVLYVNYTDYVEVNNIRFETSNSGWGHNLVFLYTNLPTVYGCSFANPSSVSGSGLWIVEGQARIAHNMVDGVDGCFGVDGGTMTCRDNGGSNNKYAYKAYGGRISYAQGNPNVTSSLTATGDGGTIYG